MAGAGLGLLIGVSSAAHEVLHVLNPDLRAIHDSGPRLPEECVLGMGTDLHNWGFTSTTRLDSYARWLADEDLSGTYERYRHAIEALRSEEHTSELQSLMRISYAVFCLKKKTHH